MKILTINTRYIGGGGAAYIANMLHREINKINGYQSTFFYGRGVDGDENSIRIIHPKMEYLSALSYRLFSKELNFNKDIEQKIIECDIVHLHNIHGYYINYVKLFKLLKKYDKKIVWTLHDMWSITGRCAYTFGCEKWKEKCGQCENKKSYPISMIDRSDKELVLKKEIIGTIDKNNMTIVTPSKWLANICRETYLNKFNICSIPNGIEHDVVTLSKEKIRNKYNIPNNKIVILFVAADTNDERKGVKYILDIISDCEDKIFISIGKKIENVKFNNLIQLGYISDRDKVNEIYFISDVFIIPSLDENFPTTVIEAFSNGTPVVGFNIGGIPEQISLDVGKVLNNISSEQIKYEIFRLTSDKKKLSEYSSNARRKFINEYNKDIFLKRYIEIYNDIYEKI